MTDAWDDDEFEVNLPVAAEEAAWDDDEEDEPPPLANHHGDAPKLSTEKEEKLKRAKAAAKAADIEASLEGETAEEMRERLQDQIEGADQALTDDLFGGGGGGGGGGVAKTTVVEQGVDGYPLKQLKDFVTLAVDVAEAFEKKKSKPNFQTKFAKELLKRIEGAMTTEDCDEIIGMCSGFKVALEKAKKQPTAKKADAAKGGKTKSKKAVAEDKKKHADLFGGFVEDEYQGYEEEFDDFM